ncbi:MAG: hypothetical protein ACP5OA_03355 [Candidatus Woesearchaeota archaeon]
MNKFIEIATGIILTVFALAFGSIIMFGYMNTLSGTALFKAMYFGYVLLVLTSVYLMSTGLLSARGEHILILISIIIFSVSIATLAGKLKYNVDANQFISTDNMAQLTAQNQYYAKFAESQVEQLKAIQDNNNMLESTITNISTKINNRKPIINEIVITLPPEIIYEERVDIPIIREDEREVEDD